MLKLLQAVREGESQSNRQVALLFHWLFQTKLEHCLHSCQAKKKLPGTGGFFAKAATRGFFFRPAIKGFFSKIMQAQGV